MSGDSRPNVIICCCDQLRAFEVGCYGSDGAGTPHLDRLAAGGVRFETACSNNPVCTAARSILISGMYSRSCNGMTGNVGDPDDIRRHLPRKTLAECFGEAGYDTALIGKWHIQPRPDLVGFDHFVFPRFRHRHRGRQYFDNCERAFGVDGWSWDYEMNQLRSWLSQRGDEPFFLYFNIEPPHMPLADAPEEYTRMYDPAGVKLRPNVPVADGGLPYDEEWLRIYLWDYLYYVEKQPHTLALPEGFDLRRLIAMYQGLTTLVDDQVGKLMSALADAGVAEETLLVFVSDHGDNLGSHGCWNKSMLFEESIRIPMIFHWPGRLEGRVIRSQVGTLVDVMPTLLGLSGVEIPDHAQGTDLSAVVRGEALTAGRNAAFIETVLDGIGIRTVDHLYGIRLKGASVYSHDPADDEIIEAPHRFYDVRSDPYEVRNLAGTGEQGGLATDLGERLVEWHRRTAWHVPASVAGGW